MSPAQRRLLEAVRDGLLVRDMGGWKLGGWPVDHPCIEDLIRSGWIEYGPHGRIIYTLSQAGREALECEA